MRALFSTFLLLSVTVSESYKILGIFPLNSKSHFVMFERLFKGLAEKGHEVDVVSHFPQKNPTPRYNDLSIAGSMPNFVNNLSVSLVDDMSFVDTVTFMLNAAGVDSCEGMFKTEVVKNLRKTTKKYDLLVTEIFGTDCALGFAHIFDIPIVALTSSVALPWGNDRIGNPDNPSYIPNYFVPYLSEMTLIERFINTLKLIAAKIGYDYISMRKSNALAKDFFGSDLPDLRDLAYKTSLVLVNSHFSVNQARPTVPNFVEVAGLHINDQKPLPKNLKELIDNSTGVVYLSMGSMVLTETFSRAKLEGFFEAFSLLPYQILWKASKDKFPADLPIPKNIHFESWMPQSDILCHQKVKLFVTHGGLMGTQEALKCGVPRLGIPIFADQQLNIRQSVAMGLAIHVSYHNITKESILEAANELLKNPQYKINAQKISKLFTDRQSTPLETAIYWVEYVIRHKGAPHLRSRGAELAWYQYYLIDIILISTLLLSAIVFISYTLLIKITSLSNSTNKLKRH